MVFDLHLTRGFSLFLWGGGGSGSVSVASFV